MVATANNVTFIPATKVIGVKASPEEKPRLRVAAYCRVSTDREEQESSFDAQVEHYRGICHVLACRGYEDPLQWGHYTQR